MSAVLQGAIAVAVSALAGVSGTVYAARVLRRRDEAAAGIRTLASMSWREFIHLVLAAMAGRGFVRGQARDGDAGEGDYTLVRGSERWTLWCKHGSAFVIGKLTVNELANAMRLAGTHGGLLVTQGRIVEDARDAAAPHGIEMLDGPALWPEVRPLLSPAQLASIRSVAMRRTRGRIAVVWGLALLLGVGSHGLAGHVLSSPASPETAGATRATATGITAPPSAPDALPSMSPPVPAPPPEARPAEPASGPVPAPLSAGAQRDAAARAVAALPMVDRARWTSASTLQIDLRASEEDAFDRICPLVEQHPDIAASRIQLNLPAGSEVPVRFRQCRTF